MLRGVDHASVASESPSGIAMTDEESILGHLETFCNHVRNMMDIIHTLAQFSKLITDVKNLPRMSLEVVMNDPRDKDEQCQDDNTSSTMTQPYVNSSESDIVKSDGSRISSDGMCTCFHMCIINTTYKYTVSK